MTAHTESDRILEDIFDPSCVVAELLIEELITLDEGRRLSTLDLGNAEKLHLLFTFLERHGSRDGLEKLIGILDRKGLIEVAQVLDERIYPKEQNYKASVSEQQSSIVATSSPFKSRKRSNINSRLSMMLPQVSSPDKLLENLQRDLRKLYKSELFSKLIPIPGYPYSVILDDIHINLRQNYQRLRIYKESLQDISAESSHIWIVGEKGLGKTTFGKRLCHDWACDTLYRWDCVFIITPEKQIHNRPKPKRKSETKIYGPFDLAAKTLDELESDSDWSSIGKLSELLELNYFPEDFKVLFIVDDADSAAYEWALLHDNKSFTFIFLSTKYQCALDPSKGYHLELSGLSDNQQGVIIRYHLKTLAHDYGQAKLDLEGPLIDILERCSPIREILRAPILLCYFVAAFNSDVADQILRVTDVLQMIISWAVGLEGGGEDLLRILQEAAFESLKDSRPQLYPQDFSLETINSGPLTLHEGMFFCQYSPPKAEASSCDQEESFLALNLPHPAFHLFFAACHIQKVLRHHQKFPQLTLNQASFDPKLLVKFLAGITEDGDAQEMMKHLRLSKLLRIQKPPEPFTFELDGFHCEVFEETNSRVFRQCLAEIIEEATHKNTASKIMFKGTLTEAKIFLDLLGSSECEICYMRFQDEDLQNIPEFQPLPLTFVPDVKIIWLFIEYSFYSNRIVEYVQSIAKPLFLWFIEGEPSDFGEILNADPVLLSVSVGKLSHASLYLSTTHQISVPLHEIPSGPLETSLSISEPDTNLVPDSIIPRLKSGVLTLSGEARQRYSDLFAFDNFMTMSQTQRLNIGQPEEGSLQEVIEFGAEVMDRSDPDFVADFLQRNLHHSRDSTHKVLNENDPFLQAAQSLQENIFLWRELCQVRLQPISPDSKITYIGSGSRLSDVLELLSETHISEFSARLQGSNSERSWFELPSWGKSCWVGVLRLDLSEIGPGEPFPFPFERFQIQEALILENLSGADNLQFLPSLQERLPAGLKTLIFRNVKLPAGSNLNSLPALTIHPDSDGPQGPS